MLMLIRVNKHLLGPNKSEYLKLGTQNADKYLLHHVEHEANIYLRIKTLLQYLCCLLAGHDQSREKAT